ncbi:hypothetical protein [Sanguibacter sp. Leaf3]|uniref:hypothetical protein n=1 Tax=Sanguibacter sp. Leaf3 TaxID=1736209 RepID=UPI00190FD7C7|nr:hypothetical protein [Sanguibacter sp. Leaf3]
MQRITETWDSLQERRAKVLASLGMSREELRARVRVGSLSGAEWAALESLTEIAFLLDDAVDDI